MRIDARVDHKDLVRIYLALLGVSLVLSAILAARHIPAIARPANPLMVHSASPVPLPSRAGAPTINWGGQRR
jgi:hypothetical protein